MVPAKAISGFPEWLPEEKIIEDKIISKIAKAFRSFGYTPLETAAVELTEVIAAKGVEHKEIYSLKRLHDKSEGPGDTCLHFDLTVPFARYVAQNQGKLVYPFKRYQIQKVWRGERPAQGRFREFYQCDIDVVGFEKLPLAYDGEILEVVGRIFSDLDIGEVVFIVNNRKLLESYYAKLQIEGELYVNVLTEVDKIQKIGPENLSKILKERFSLDETVIKKILHFAEISVGPEDLDAALKEFSTEDEKYLQGSEELKSALENLPKIKGISWRWQGSVTRGLNYYTGNVFESILVGSEALGSICSGGRYEDLTRLFTKLPYPGVGISIGLTRLLSHLFKNGYGSGGAPCPTNILVACLDDSRRKELGALAQELRDQGLNVELSPVTKLKKQMAYANKKKIASVIIPNDDDSYELKDMSGGEQKTLSREEVLKHFSTHPSLD